MKAAFSRSVCQPLYILGILGGQDDGDFPWSPVGFTDNIADENF